MKKYFYFALLSSILSVNTYASTVAGPKLGARIVGGELVDATKTETRYIVSLNSSCAGSIIDAKWILTAAHCKSLFTRPVTAGSIDLNDKNRIRLEVKRSYIHKENSSSKYTYDIALLELKNPIDFEATGLRPIPMVTPAQEELGALSEGVMSTVLGWGATREGGSVSRLMRMVEVPLVSNEVANAPTSYNGQIDDSMLVAGYAEGKKDACQGDSGGPLVIEGTDGSPVLAGVVSWGRGCARAKYYGVYANVAKAYPWIIETMAAAE